MVAVISVYAYHILAFSDLTCHLEDMGIGVSGCTVQTKLRKSNQEASPSAGENTWVVLVPCFHVLVPQLFSVVWIFLRSLDVICYDRCAHSKVTEIASRIGVS